MVSGQITLPYDLVDPRSEKQKSVNDLNLTQLGYNLS